MPVTTGTKVLVGVAVALLLLAATVWIAREAAPAPEPDIVFSPAPDTVPLLPQDDAVGLCALSRTTGVLEGRIVAVTEPTGESPPRYRVETMDGSGRQMDLCAEAVMLDLCERAVQAAPQREPIRVQPEPR